MKRIILIIAALAGMAFASLAADTPVFPGGDKALQSFISENLKYPDEARANGIEGVVNVAFTVKADGTIGGIKIVRMVDPDLENEAIRIVRSMPKWEPATKGGAPVDGTVQIAVPFNL